jgi:carotenoid cleavage dioxygenase-like enzyme
VCDKSGTLVRSFPVAIPAPVMMHDIAITANFTLFYDYNNR